MYSKFKKHLRWLFIPAVLFLIQLTLNFTSLLCLTTLIISMSDIEDYLKVLQEWKEQSGKTITSVLTRIDETKTFKGRDLDDILKGVTDFHKEITKAAEDTVDLKWYELCISSKKKLKKMQEAAEKQRKSQPVLEKKPSNTSITYP